MSLKKRSLYDVLCLYRKASSFEPKQFYAIYVTFVSERSRYIYRSSSPTEGIVVLILLQKESQKPDLAENPEINQIDLYQTDNKNSLQANFSFV